MPRKPSTKNLIVGMAEIQALMCCGSINTVKEWTTKGCPYLAKYTKKGTAWKFNAADVIAWRIEYLLSKEQAQTSGKTLAELKVEGMEIEVRRNQIKLDQELHSLAPVDAMREIMADQYMRVKQALRSMPSRLQKKLEGEARMKIKEILESDIRRTLENLAGFMQNEKGEIRNSIEVKE